MIKIRIIMSKYKDHDIYSNGFDRFLSRGNNLPIADLNRPLSEQGRKDDNEIKNQPILRKAKYKKTSKTTNKYWISYTKNRNVILDDKYIVNTMQFERISDCWFDYIFNNPNKKITLEEIEKETKKTATRGYNFNKFLDNIKFKGQLRKLFFKQGKGVIIFYNPVTEMDFEERASINIKKLKQEINKLKKIE